MSDEEDRDEEPVEEFDENGLPDNAPEGEFDPEGEGTEGEGTEGDDTESPPEADEADEDGETGDEAGDEP